MQEKILNCYRAFSKVSELYRLGSSGGVVTTLALVALENSFADGFFTLDRVKGCWQVADDLDDLKRACGSTYKVVSSPKHFLSSVRFSADHFEKYGLIGKPCDMFKGFSPLISIFCSRAWKTAITKEGIAKQSYFKSILKMPLKCSSLFCRDHVGKKADVSVGDSQTHKKINVVVVRTELGQKLFDLAIKLNYLSATKSEYNSIRTKQPYLWR